MENLINKIDIEEIKIVPIILCGGIGSRLWPYSRESFPKQFLPINSQNGKSLLQNTLLRTTKLKNLSEPILICNEKHRFIVAEQIRELDINPKSIIIEPFGRNTAPPVIFSALKAMESEANPHLLILSSDHQIQDEIKFRNVIEFGKKYSQLNKLVTFGVVPQYPETGYGYIKSEEPFDNKKLKASKILKFIEKPDLNKAKEYLKDPSFTWNSGIFLFRAKSIIEEMKNLNPDLFGMCKETLEKSKIDLDFLRLDINSFESCPNISLDVAIMEKTKKAMMVPLSVQWSDIGSWKSVWENSEKDNNGNSIKGEVFTKQTDNCYLYSENKLLVSLGIKDLVVIDTDDATLVANKDLSQNIKEVVNDLKIKNIKQSISHRKGFRPWGYYKTILEDKSWQVKIIHVKAGAKLSLQLHHHRSEHWIVVKGTAEAEIENKKILLSENQSIYIPLGSKHRLSNPGKVPLEIIEVQSGSYIGEDDIVRFEDIYGRHI